MRNFPEASYRISCMERRGMGVASYISVPISSDVKIRELFDEIASAKDEAEVRRFATELQMAMTEHSRPERKRRPVGVARDSVESLVCPPPAGGTERA